MIRRHSNTTSGSVLDLTSLYDVPVPARFPFRRAAWLAHSGRTRDALGLTAMIRPHDPRQNLLLATLDPEDYARLCPQLELVPLPLGWSVYEAGNRQGYVYFPTTSVVSLICAMGDGKAATVAATGNDGLVGMAPFMGDDCTPMRAAVQSAGYAYRLRVSDAKAECQRGSSLRTWALRYAQALMIQMGQTAVCNRLHGTQQQLCRWLLLTLDSLVGNKIVVTQELIASTLGTRREGVSESAAKLREAGLIKCGRGHVTVLDREKLEVESCECYAAVKKEMNRLLPYRMRAAATHDAPMPSLPSYSREPFRYFSGSVSSP